MFLRPEPDLGWFPTHVQVTILEAKGLRAKGKHGTSDAYTLIQVGREKYSTSVVEKTPGSPEWKEECTFELSPGALERGENCDLQLTVMHRALIGMDQFLGQANIALQTIFQEGRSQRNQWYKLHSKPGKKEKERGEIQVSIQFTRNNLTASMFDLSIKDKPKTPFGKLKDKMKIKKRFDMESSSAIVPSSVGRLDSDEEEEKKPKSKAAAFFKGHLRKSSLTKSNTSLGSDSTISSSSGAVPTNTGISIVVSDTGKKPAARNNSLSTEPSVMDQSSPRLTHKRAFSDEVGQVNTFPEPKAVQNLKPKSSPISKSSMCINGSHVYTEVPPPRSPSLEKSSQASKSFQNILKKAEEAVVPEALMRQTLIGEKPERKSATPPVSSTEEEKISLKMTPKPKTDQARVETKPVQVTSPMVFSEDLSKNKVSEVKPKEEKAKDGLQLGSGKKVVNKTGEDPSPHVPSSSEDRSKVGSWFGSKDAKDTPQKPSFPYGSIATSEAAERGSTLVEEHSPPAFFPPAEDPTSSLYKKGIDSVETSDINDSSASPETVSEWEEQFDAFASSRLQKSPETKEHFIGNSEKNPSLLFFGVHGPEIRQDYGEENRLNRPSSQAPFWSEHTENDRKKADKIPFPRSPSSFPTSYIPPYESASIQTFTSDLSADQRQYPSMELPISKPSPIKFKYVETSQTENKVASVSPIMIKEQNQINSEDKSQSLVRPNNSQTNIIYSSTKAESTHELRDSNNVIIEEVKAAIQPRQQALIEHNFVRVGEDLSPEPFANEKAPVENRVNELIKEQAISADIGSLAPPKPPQLMLPPAFEPIESDVDNCKQTSFQDTSGKQTESPEEHKLEQNMGDSKHTHSPVACCPVIEIRSPVLGSTTEHTQSTAEGLLTNLREGNNELSKLGAANGEHLLDVNDTSAAEQFRTCLSNVSLDSSSLQENSNKLEIIKHGPSELLSTLGDNKQDNEDFIFQKPTSLPKKQKGNRTEDTSASKKHSQSDVLFWSALEEQVPSSMAEPTMDMQNVNVSLESSKLTNQTVEYRTEPSNGKNKDLISHLTESHSPLANEISSTLESSEKILEESHPSVLLSQQSSWSADIIVDFKNEDFWKTDSDQLAQNDLKSLPSPGNPFTPTDKAPLGHKNPFVDHSTESQHSESSLQEDMSFKDLHARAIGGLSSDVITVRAPYVHGNQPLAFSTPSFLAAPNPKSSTFPSPIQFSTASGVTTTANAHIATLSYLHSPASSGVTSPAPVVLPQETQPAENPFVPLKTSPHPVKPISATPSEPAHDKKAQKPVLSTALTSGLELLKHVTTGQHPSNKKQEVDRLKDVSSPDQAAKYYHLTHDELIKMLLQREAELENKALHMQELEDYIDKLLVRIMDQAPALLQVPLETKK
ncbi:uncharacterized protein LOC143975605 [Lithobates pipiens]